MALRGGCRHYKSLSGKKKLGSGGWVEK